MNHPTQEEPAALQLAKALRDYASIDFDGVFIKAAEELERLHFIVNGSKVDPASVVAAAGVVA